jgi:SAM-dependent methyltransferase
MVPPQASSPRAAAVGGAGYVRKDDNVLRRAGFSEIDYSDGPDAEQRVYAAVRRARDRSTFSVELARAITDWPSEYHLSRERHCIVRPLGIQPGERVLELGCGCGAITRYLGEIGAAVTAVEGAGLRARIAAERCRDLPNVTVVLDDVLEFATAERFDWVLLIGVLEYAPVYSHGPDPIARMLRAAAASLGSQGRLVVAIENKLGLKYFNGCGEDHIGIPFYGLQGLYGAHTPRTFGRAELVAHVQGAGLAHVAFHYPFPDYKLPRVILSEAALSDPAFDAAGTTAYVQARDYDGRAHRLFDEALVARELGVNGLLGELSNSFLLVAAREALASDGALATAFSAYRDAEFAAQTRFVRDGETIRVEKTRLYPQYAGRRRFADGSILENVPGAATYVRGPLALTALTQARARRGDLGAIVTALVPWFDLLLARARPASGRRLSDFTLAGSDLDLMPANLAETEAGLVPIDKEWRIDRDIPLGWVVTRSVIHSLRGIAGFERDAVAVVDVIGALCARRGLQVDEDEIAAWLRRENELQELCGNGGFSGRAGSLISRRMVPPSDPDFAFNARIIALTRTASELETKIEQMYQSRSWRYAYPLRVAGQILRGAPLADAAHVPAAVARGAPKDDARSHAGPARPWSHRDRLWAWLTSDLGRYGRAIAAVLAAFALTHLLTAYGIRTPRMLLYIAAVAVAARFGGLGPGVLALAASVPAILLSAPSFSHVMHDVVRMERLAFFLVCAAIGILVSVPHARERRARHPEDAPRGHNRAAKQGGP